MDIVDTVDIVDAVDIVDIVDTVDIVDIVDTVDTLDTVHTVDKGKVLVLSLSVWDFVSLPSGRQGGDSVTASLPRRCLTADLYAE